VARRDEDLVTRLGPERGEGAADPAGADNADLERMHLGRLAVLRRRGRSCAGEADRGDQSTRMCRDHIRLIAPAILLARGAGMEKSAGELNLATMPRRVSTQA